MFRKLSSSLLCFPAAQMRYNTAGDWEVHEEKKHIHFSVTTAETGNWRYDALLQVHELIEAILCINNNVQEEDVSKFDMSRTPDGPDGDCGDDPLAPYSKEHCFATAVERMLCAAMGVEWDDYSSRVEEVMEDYKEKEFDKPEALSNDFSGKYLESIWSKRTL
jgi:hypothetical protein